MLRPTLPLDDAGHSRSVDAESLAYCRESQAVVAEKADLRHLFLGEFCGRMASVCNPVATALDDFVGAVESCRSQFKMGRIHTSRVIASMHDEHPWRNRPEGEFIGDTMGLPEPTIDANMTVAIESFGASPFPAFGWPTHMGVTDHPLLGAPIIANPVSVCVLPHACIIPHTWEGA